MRRLMRDELHPPPRRGAAPAPGKEVSPRNTSLHLHLPLREGCRPRGLGSSLDRVSFARRSSRGILGLVRSQGQDTGNREMR